MSISDMEKVWDSKIASRFPVFQTDTKGISIAFLNRRSMGRLTFVDLDSGQDNNKRRKVDK